MPSHDITLFDVELHSKGSTGPENSDSTSYSFISRSGLEIFVNTNCIFITLCCWKLGAH